MGVEPIIADIAKTKADVIVNSIGVGDGLKQYGGICRSIVSEMKDSSELEAKIKEAKDIYVLGDFFVTGGYGLQVNKIIHLVTPYYEKDKDMLILTDCIRRILYWCAVNHQKHIAIPLIGAGANGYDCLEIEKMLCKIADCFMDVFKECRVEIVKPKPDKEKENRDRIKKEMPSDGKRLEIKNDVRNGSKRYKGAKKLFSKIQNSYQYFQYGTQEKRRPSIFSTDLDNPKKIVEYANKYLEKRYCDDDGGYLEDLAEARMKAFLGFGRHKPIDSGGKYLAKMTDGAGLDKWFALILGLKMDYDEAVDFLRYFGRSFPSKVIFPGVDIVVDLIKTSTFDFYEIKERINLFD